MAQFIAFTSGVEVNGETVLSVVNGVMMKDFVNNTLKENGIADPQPGQWYSQQKWLDAFKFLSEKIGPIALYKIGRQIPENANWPPNVNSIETALASIDIAYHMNHRIAGTTLFNPITGAMKEGIGHYKYEKVSDKKIKMVCENPYPCEFDKGIIYEAAFKFKPAEVTRIIVSHEKEEVACRKKGGRSCTYLVEW